MRNKGTNSFHKKDRDILSDYFRDTLENHQLEVNEKCWDNISTRIRPNIGKRIGTKNRKVLWLALCSGAAAIVLFMLILDLRKDVPAEQLLTASEGSIVKSNVERPYEKPALKQIAQIHPSSANFEKDSISIDDKPQNPPQDMEEKKQQEIDTKTNKQALTKDADYYSEEDNKFPAEEPGRKRGWKLSASLGAYGKTSNQLKSDLTVSKVQYMMDVGPRALLASNSIEDAEYAAPLSFGLLVRKELNKTLSLETGLVYSYLYTSYKNNDHQQYRAKLKLHYIGIPVNLVADIWNITPHCKIYSSAGIMAEKGIRSDFSQYISETQQTISDKQSIQGMQWSINASVGVSYKFYRNWNIYMEPHVSFYFDNDQPISIRTERQTIIGINSGLRLDL